MNRFGHEKVVPFWRNLIITAAAFAAAFALLFYGLTQVSATTSREEARSLKDAISRGITHCYAVEGAYPESLAYLEERYGISYDTTKYYVDYRPIASNIMPDVTVISLEEP